MTEPTTPETRERLANMIRTDRGDMNVYSEPEVRAALDAYRAAVLADATPSVPVSSPPADQTALRQRVAEAIAADDGHPWDTLSRDAEQHYLDNAVAALAAVLPTTNHDTDTGAAIAEDLRYVLNYRGPEHAHERPGFWDTSGRSCTHCARLAIARMNLADHDAEVRGMADETAATETDDTVHTCPGRWGGPSCRCFDTEPAVPEETDEERTDREETERDHAAGNHQYCGVTCEVEMPTEHLRNFVIAKGYPGTKGALDELLRRARAAVLPTTNHDTDTSADAPAAECSAQHRQFDDGRLCIRAAQHHGDHIDERGYHWSDTVAVYPVADGTFRTGTDVRAVLRRVADETAATETQPDEDSARVDRLRPEFFEQASVESIDVQIRRAQRQQRNWGKRERTLATLRRARVTQKEHGEWPAAGARQDGAQPGGAQ